MIATSAPPGSDDRKVETMSEDRVLRILRESDASHATGDAAATRGSRDRAKGGPDASRATRPPGPESKAILPKHNIESVVVAEYGGVFVVGWIDDTVEELDKIRVVGNSWQVVFAGAALARTGRDDVQSALGSARRHAFGFWGFAADKAIGRGSSHCAVDVYMKNGAQQRIEVPVRVVDQFELRNLILMYLASCRYLGNPQLDSIAAIAKSAAEQIVNFNLWITRDVVSEPYVERFCSVGTRRKGSIVVCLYGKPEYLFLQHALFSGRPGIEDYEFVYVCNSPELAERLLREARIASLSYGLDLTLVLLPGNAGFGAANNAAVKVAASDRVLIVNPDVFPLAPDWAMRHTDIVEQQPAEQTRLFGAPLYYDDGSLMHGGMYFDADVGLSLDKSVFKRATFLRVEHYGKGAPPSTEQFLRSRPVPAITGAFMSCDRAWFEKLGGFTEEFVFGHYEDADLCLKSIAAGIAPWMHDVKLWHLEGKGSIRLPTHEGGSIVNRWLFNKRWANTVMPDMLGPAPCHPLLAAEARPILFASAQSAAAAAGAARRRPTKLRRLAQSSANDRPISGCTEIVFDAGNMTGA
jgi:GT2 family glycosyltransferase